MVQRLPRPFFSSALSKLATLALLAVGLVLPLGVQASHGIAGQITYRYVPDPSGAFSNTYEITLITYTDPCALGVDRPNVTLQLFGVGPDGSLFPITSTALENIPRINPDPMGSLPQPGEIIRQFAPDQCVQRNVYRATVTLPGDGVYLIRYFDPFRVANVINMTNSFQTTFFVETSLVNLPFLGPNSSPELLNEPFDFACTGQIWTHNPSARDQLVDPDDDADSISYELLVVRQADPNDNGLTDSPVLDYRFPNEVNPGPGNTFGINAQTGLITWNVPLGQPVGYYAIAFAVNEFRNGQRVGRVVRDMMVFVEACTNEAPELDIVDDTCANVNVPLQLNFRARDPNRADSVYFYFTNSGTPNRIFTGEVSNPATVTFTRPNPVPAPVVGERARNRMFTIDPGDTLRPLPTEYAVEGFVTWTPSCFDIAGGPYRLDYYAVDNLGPRPPEGSGLPGSFAGSNPGFPLAANALSNIRINAPGVTNLTATPGPARTVQLSWTNPVCAASLPVQYEIYRSADSLTTVQDDSCCDGNAGPGYQLIATLLTPSATSFIDTITSGISGAGGQVCYRVVVAYPRQSSSGIVYDINSCPSVQACADLAADAPIPLRHDVQLTDPTGQVFLEWQRPDTTGYTPPAGPYTYSIRYAEDGVTGLNYITIQTGRPFNDTTFTFTSASTTSAGQNYVIDVIDVNGNPVISSALASAIKLAATGQSESVLLEWTLNVPWANTDYEIYRSDNPPPATPVAGIPAGFALVGTLSLGDPATPDQSGFLNTGQTDFFFVDRDPALVQSEDYFYLIRSTGAYNNPGITSETLLNKSNIDQAVVLDTTPPCVPPFTATVDCEAASVTLNWTEDPGPCDDDLAEYRVYFKREITLDSILICVINRNMSGVYSHVIIDSTTFNVTGCYAIQAIDSSGNASEVSEFLCVADECPQLLLPNVFTPNGDEANNRFIPLQYDPVTGQPTIITRGVLGIVCQIYDRTGRLLNTSTDINNLWDGNVNGSPAPVGTYFYYIEARLSRTTGAITIKRSGEITLLR